MVETKLFEIIAAIVGSNNVSDQDFARFSYAKDWSAIPIAEGCVPSIVVMPTTKEEVVEIFRLANKEKIPITTWGGGTGLTGGALASKGGILIDTRRMNKVIKIDTDSMTVTTQPGITVTELGKILGERGFMLGHSPVSNRSCTVGGNISTDGIGFWGMRFGEAGRQVVALEVVLPTGEIIRTGRNVLKSSTGYKLHWLFVGAEGTLGIITEATLKIYPLPETLSKNLVILRNIETAIHVAKKMVQAGLVPHYMEIQDRDRARTYVSKAMEMGLVLEQDSKEIFAILGFGFGGTKEVVDNQTSVALKICLEQGGKDLGAELAEEWFQARYQPPTPYSLIKTTLDKGKRFLTIDCSVPIENFEKLYDHFQALVEKHGLVNSGCCLYLGGLPLVLIPSFAVYVDTQNDSEWERFERFCNDFIRTTLELGGTITSHTGVGLRHREFVEDELGTALRLMKSIKRLLDPNSIMNPGKKWPQN